MTKTMTAAQALERIQTAKPDPEVRVARRMEIGQAIHQGDVYLTRVADDHGHGKVLGTRQVAVGTTIGSRHVVEGDGVEVFQGTAYPEGFKVPEGIEPSALLGPLVRAIKGLVLTHPEHAHHRLPAGCYQVTFPADLVRMAQVLD